MTNMKTKTKTIILLAMCTVVCLALAFTLAFVPATTTQASAEIVIGGMTNQGWSAHDNAFDSETAHYHDDGDPVGNLTTLKKSAYYLTADIERDLTISGNVTLCLNGYIFTGKITISSGAKLTLLDCCEGAGCTAASWCQHEYSVDGGIVTVGGIDLSAEGTMVLFGGTIAGCEAGIHLNGGSLRMEGGVIASNDTGIKVSDGSCTLISGVIFDNDNGVEVVSKFTMQGGEIDGNGNGVYVNGGNFTMSSGGTISNNTNGIYVESGNATLQINGEIRENEVGVYVNGGKLIMNGSCAISDNEMGVHIATGGDFSMFNGTISGTTGGDQSYGVYIDGGAFSMTGGSVTGNDNGVYFGSSGAMEVGGTAVIKQNDQVNTFIGSGNTISINAIESGAQIDVTLESGKGVFTSNWSDEYGSPSDYFTSTDGDVVNYNGQAAIGTAHYHNNELFIELLEGVDVINGGKYFLSDNYSGNLDVLGEVELCLNGHELSGSGSVLTVLLGAHLTLLDCDANSQVGSVKDGDVGVYVLGGTLSISGAVQITENEQNVYLTNNSIIEVNDGLVIGSNKARIGVSLSADFTGTVITRGYGANLGEANPKDYFIPDSDELCLYLEGGEANMTKHNWDDWQTLNEGNATDPFTQTRTCSRCGDSATRELELLEIVVTADQEYNSGETELRNVRVTAYFVVAGADNDIIDSREDVTGYEIIYNFAQDNHFTPADTAVEVRYTLGGKTVFATVEISVSTSQDELVIPEDGVLYSREDWHQGKSATEEHFYITFHSGAGYTVIYYTDSECTQQYVGAFGSLTPAGTYYVKIFSAAMAGYQPLEMVIGSFTVTPHTKAEITEQTRSNCKEPGKIVYKCGVEGCGETITEYLPLEPHTISEIKDELQPTCTKDGYVVFNCAVCGEEDVTEVISALGHQLDLHDHKPATCSETGYEVYNCIRCNYTENNVLPTVDHDWVLVEEVYGSTCGETGHKTYKCSFGCGETRTEQTEARDHDWVADETGTILRHPTCTDTGLGSVVCTVCGAKKDGAVIPALGHDYVGVVTTQPTCTSVGMMTYTCSICSDDYTVDIDKLEHDYVLNRVIEDATCTKAGSNEYICIYCQDIKTETTEALRHNWGTGFIIKAATCTQQGQIKYVCANCGAEEFDTIPTTEHSWIANGVPTVAPTCTAAGYGNRVCQLCGADGGVGEIPALGHNFESKITKIPNCTENGVRTYTCSRCTDSYTEKIDALGHAWDNGEVSTPATCTELGKIVFTCDNCGESYTTTLDLIEHDWEVDADLSRDATCVLGAKLVEKCSVCGLVREQITSSALGHDWYVVEGNQPTCTQKGSGKLACSRCDAEKDNGEVPALGHLWVVDGANSTPASCVKAGKTVYICGRVGCEDGATYFETTPAVGHDMRAADITPATCTRNGYVTYKCVNCEDAEWTEVILAHGHSLDGGIETHATCTEFGKITFSCTYDGCDYSYEEIVSPARGHVADEGEVVTQADCEHAGSIVYKCVYCGDELETETVDPLGHDYVADGNVTQYPTCMQPGIGSMTCSRCGATVEEGEIPKLEHEFESTVVQQPTCLKTGVIRHTCKNCGTTYTEDIAATGHAWDKGVVSKDATCTAYGETTYTCVHCGDTNVEGIEPVGHAFGELEVKNVASCEQNGLAIRTCTRCWHIEQVVLDATGHNWVEDLDGTVIKSPTCTEVGFGGVICTVCGAKLDGVEIPATGHDWAEKEILSYPTCSVKGETVYFCKLCGELEVRYTDELGHMWDEGTVSDATCTTAGKITYACLYGCEETITQEIAALGHAWGEGVVTIQPKCVEKGLITYTCTRCGTAEEPTTKTKELDELGHNWVSSGDAKKKPTCTQPGQGAIVCSHCGLTQDDGVIPALGHTWNTVETAATCTKDGKIVRTCSVCGVTEEEVISATGHDWNDGVVTTPEGCEKVGIKTYTCLSCNDTYTVEIAATGHVWNDGDVTIFATCVKVGVKTYTCSTCMGTREEEIAALGHDWESVEGTVEPKCTESVTTSVICSRCQATKVTGIIPALGHDWVTEEFAPSCTEPGRIVRQCSRGCDIEEIVVLIPATGHEWVESERVDATCASVGSITYKCNHEGCEQTKTVEVPALAHDWQIDSVKKPTNTVDGEIVYKCSHCGATKTEIIYATGVPFEVDEPTPVTDGDSLIWLVVLLSIILVVSCGILISQLVSASSDDSNDENDESDGADTSTTVRGNA